MAIGMSGVIAIGMVIGAIWGRGGSETEAGDAPGQTVSEIVSATDLAIAYGRNQVAADIRFKDKIIIVGGRIKSIGKDVHDGPYVSLITGDYTTVRCMFADTDTPELSRLQPWQTVRIKGRCGGSPYSRILLHECKLVW